MKYGVILDQDQENQNNSDLEDQDYLCQLIHLIYQYSILFIAERIRKIYDK